MLGANLLKFTLHCSKTCRVLK